MAQTSSFNILTTFSTSWNVWPPPHSPSISSGCHAVTSLITSLPAPIVHKSHLASLHGNWAHHSVAPSQFIKHVSLFQHFQGISSTFQCLLESKQLSTSNFHDFAYDVSSSQNAPSFSTFPKLLPASMIPTSSVELDLSLCCYYIFDMDCIHFGTVSTFCLQVHL